MIVLRIRIDGETQEHVFQQARVALGSARDAGLRQTKAGWPARAGTLMRRGTQVVLVVPGRVGTIPLRSGEPIMLGRAELTWLGETPAPAPQFGDYDLPPAPTPGPTSAAPQSPGAATSTAASPAAASTTLPAAGAMRFALEEAPKTSGTTTATPPAPPGAQGPGETASAAATPPAGDQFGRSVDFDAELYNYLKRTPWFLASMVLHLVVFLIFYLVRSPVEVDPRARLGRVSSELTAETSREEAGPEPEAEEPEREAEPVVPERAPDLQELDREPAPVEAPEIELGPMLVEEEPPSDLGTAPTLADAGRKTAPKATRPRPAPSIDLERSVAKDNLHDVRRQAATHVREKLGVGNGGPGEALTTLSADDLVVVQGEYDHQERVLRELSIPYRSVAATDPKLESGEVLKKARFLFWNCGMPPSERLLRRLTPVVREFVQRGGYLFSSDWVIGHVLAHAYPDLLTTHGSAAAIPHTVIGIRPVTAQANHPLLEGVFHTSVAGRWWLESRSLDIVVLQPEVVTVLIESPELKDLYNASTAVAITFARGSGRVLHVLGHYDQEEGNVAGTVAVQRLALNFVLQSLRERPLKPRR